jgi:hypothetical protein
MVGRPKNSADPALAAKVNSARRAKGMSIRALAAAASEARSTVHRFLIEGVIPGGDLSRVHRLMAAIDNSDMIAIGRSRRDTREELMGQFVQKSQELVTLLCHLDEMMRNRG